MTRAQMKYDSPESIAKAEAAWLAALRLQQFQYGNISYEVSVSLAHATRIVRNWESSGKVRRINEHPRGSARLVFEVVPEGEITSAPIGDAFDQMWFTMRKAGAFSPVDLVALSSVALTVEEAASYCRTLLAAGYLRVVQKAAPPGKQAIYRLTNTTGVRAPRARRVMCLVDPNLGTIKPLVEVL